MTSALEWKVSRDDSIEKLLLDDINLVGAERYFNPSEYF